MIPWKGRCRWLMSSWKLSIRLLPNPRSTTVRISVSGLRTHLILRWTTTYFSTQGSSTCERWQWQTSPSQTILWSASKSDLSWSSSIWWRVSCHGPKWEKVTTWWSRTTFARAAKDMDSLSLWLHVRTSTLTLTKTTRQVHVKWGGFLTPEILWPVSPPRESTPTVLS
mgnify:CR=1 FL=1